MDAILLHHVALPVNDFLIDGFIHIAEGRLVGIVHWNDELVPDSAVLLHYLDIDLSS